MKKIPLSYKLIATFLAIGLIPTLVVTWMTLKKSTDTLESKAFEQLVSAREMKKAQVVYYFDEIKKQVATLSDDLMVIDAAKEFTPAYENYSTEAKIEKADIPKMKEALRRYYKDEYLQEYKAQNDGATIDVDSLLSRMDDNDIAIQYSYIADNSNPLGSKDALYRGNGDASYHSVHKKYHGSLRHFLQEFEYYDIFIVHPETGKIIYSVFKELDFATSLTTGSYADTNFADAFNQAKRSSDKNAVFLVDYKQYSPSYEAPAGFISSPIYDDKTLVGVLVFQMPIDRLNAIMGLRAGLGESGETYLVGQDNLMRSDSYLDPEGRSVVASFRKPDTGSVDSDAASEALRGGTGESIVIDYNGNPVLSAYSPVELGNGITWALLAEIDEAEAFAAIPEMRGSALIFLGITAVLVIVVGFSMSRLVTGPIKSIFQGLNKFSTEEFEAINKTFKSIGADISGATDQISTMSNKISEASTGQAASLEETSASMEEISSVTQQNAQHAQQSSELSDAAKCSVEEGNKAMVNMSDVMNKIKSSSEEIAGILKIIDDISFQTNILALNAAVEAARAGESGAGFAVVADEVRQLAQRTANAAKDTAKLIDESVKNAQQGVESGAQVSSILKTIEESVTQATELAQSVSSASIEQTDGITQINRAITELDANTQRNAAESQELASQSVQLRQVVQNLESLTGKGDLEGAGPIMSPVVERNAAAASNGASQPRGFTQEPIKESFGFDDNGRSGANGFNAQDDFTLKN